MWQILKSKDLCTINDAHFYLNHYINIFKWLSAEDVIDCILYEWVLSLFSHVQRSTTLWTTASQAPLSMGFSRQEYWNGSHALFQVILPTMRWNSHLSPALVGRYFTLASLDAVKAKGNQPWIFIERTDAEAPILWPPDWRANSLEKTLMLEKIESIRRSGGEDEMVGWLNRREFEQPLGDSERQGSLKCCSPWGCKESDMTSWLNNSNNNSLWGKG